VLGSASVSSTADSFTAAGQIAPLVSSSQTFSSGSVGNYDITYVDGTLSISQRPITVTTAGQSRNYGSANPTVGGVTLTTGTLANADVLGSASVSSTATSTTAAGQIAPLTGSSQTFSSGTAGNYLISYVDGTLSISQRPITVTTDGQSRNYGSANPTAGATTLTTGSLANADVLGSASVSSTATSTTAAGLSAPLSASSQTFSSGTAGNYLISYVDGTLTISQRPITVTTDGQSRNYGSANPTVGATTLTTGTLANSDALSTASLSSTATSTTPAGQSAPLVSSSQTFSSGTAGNYHIT
jgi:hypothetical protein